MLLDVLLPLLALTLLELVEALQAVLAERAEQAVLRVLRVLAETERVRPGTCGCLDACAEPPHSTPPGRMGMLPVQPLLLLLG